MHLTVSSHGWLAGWLALVLVPSLSRYLPLTLALSLCYIHTLWKEGLRSIYMFFNVCCSRKPERGATLSGLFHPDLCGHQIYSQADRPFWHQFFPQTAIHSPPWSLFNELNTDYIHTYKDSFNPPYLGCPPVELVWDFCNPSFCDNEFRGVKVMGLYSGRLSSQVPGKTSVGRWGIGFLCKLIVPQCIFLFAAGFAIGQEKINASHRRCSKSYWEQ